MNPNIMRQAGFSDEVDAVGRGDCPFCHKPVRDVDFRNEISKREFGISGLCQSCQDDTFGKD